MIQFANPAFLWALTGILIPVGIHVLSRKEGRVIKLGSVRHLRESNTKQYRNLRLNEILLLLLRIALITLLVLLLSGLHIQLKSYTSTTPWALVESGLENRLSTVLDSLETQGYEVRFLEKDFPENTNQSYSTDYYKLTEALQKENSRNVIVFSNSRVVNFKGKAEGLPNHIQWITIPAEPASFNHAVAGLNEDSVYIRKGFSNENETWFETVKERRTTEQHYSLTDTLIVGLYADTGFEEDGRVLYAALHAISNNTLHPIKIVQLPNLNNEVQGLAWGIALSDNSINQSTNTVTYKSVQSEKLFVQATNNTWHLTKRLNLEEALQTNVTVQLAQLILPEQTFAQHDNRVMPEAIRWSHTAKQRAAFVSTTGNTDKLLLFLILIFLITERILAWRRNQ
ncbi:MAG: BatA domain-containing protein [Cyclobacteriaceae bacterium]|nr:BatA domain-containing protein [Cyclobacteriaceae bacterium]